MIPDISTITKDEIAQLSIEEFPGRIIVVDTVKNADKAVQYLSLFPMIGFDTETRPSFKKGMRYKVALMQLSTDEACFLFRLNRIGFPSSLKDFLTSRQHMKIGLSLRDDFCAIRRSADIQLENFVDLQQMVGEYGIEDSSLQKIYAILFGKRITKGQQLSNWEADVLTDAQKRYAVLDAWACLKIYNRLKED
ncbi:MAG: 3'-5' exonuclease domain-containing protein 2 [Tannerellaceae bacterium]|nr:3'-5' exonuclease domain-containing protein 2 [Tannerellaceae bacterium]